MSGHDFAKEEGTLAFHRDLFLEQSQEAGFLYEQRQLRLLEGHASWRSLSGLEARLDARLDALVVGHELALRVCAERAVEGDVGEVFVAMSVVCRHAHAPAMARILNSLDLADEARLVAARQALCWALPPAWEAFVERALQTGSAPLIALLAPVCGHRQLKLGPALLQAWQAHPTVSASSMDALGRLRVTEARPLMRKAMTEGDAGSRMAALLALLRLGDREALGAAVTDAKTQAWPRLALGLAGPPEALQTLLQLAASGQADAVVLHGLGLLGDPVAFDVLCAHLTHPEHAEAAATALQWMTGATLLDSTFDPEPVDEDTLVGDELQAWRERGEAPVRADGRPFGEQTLSGSKDPVRWKAWMTEQAERWVPGRRYRLGRPVDPAVLVDALVHDDSDILLRHYTGIELAVRCESPMPFDVDMPVSMQTQALAQLRAWAAGRAGAFQPGGWYFAGLPQ